MVAGVGNQPFAEIRQGNFIYIASWECRLQPVLRVHILDVVVRVEELGEEVIFIVAVPCNNGRMVTQTRDIVLHLSSDVLDEALMCRVCSAGEQEILPNEEPEFVTCVVEYILFEDTTCPDAIKSKLVRACSANSGHIMRSYTYRTVF
jgi:hypothetical protein